MSEACPLCGAVSTEGKTCEEIYHEFLALEFTDPDYGRVHFLTVACYMIQHEGYSDESYVWVESALRKYLQEGWPISMIREDAARGPGRDKGVRRPADAPHLPKIAWSMTIADVAAQMHDAESYCRLIEQWGHAALKEMGPLVVNNP
ncbi:DUF5946 family protein [Paenibacillus senegalensis]|uniref:DUF5946 family protein n=1 Tax=Paenibacillus senegalensis TaxID=1465766 RepID=UPI0002882BD5|nr:DUF5946 family protein [Paenibacillus senegalensis]